MDTSPSARRLEAEVAQNGGFARRVAAALRRRFFSADSSGAEARQKEMGEGIPFLFFFLKHTFQMHFFFFKYFLAQAILVFKTIITKRNAPACMQQKIFL